LSSDPLDGFKDKDLEKMIEESDEPEKVIKANSDILSAEMKEFERRKWENNYLCDCGASRLKDCECDLTDKQLRGWIKRTSRAMNEKFGGKAMTLLLQSTKRGGIL